MAEVNPSGGWVRGYVYAGGRALAAQEGGTLHWVHEDPVTKTKRMTSAAGAVTSSTVLDPWGGEAAGRWALNTSQQRRKYTTYERDADGGDEAMRRRYSAWWARFSQPDPYDGSYDLTDPQSFNRYSYTQNDPINFTDPAGLDGVANLDVIRETVDVVSAPAAVDTWAYAQMMGGERRRRIRLWTEGERDGGRLGGLPPNTTPDEITIQTLKDNCAIAAMLDALAYAEGNPGYGTVVRGKVIKSPNDPSLVGQRDVTITDFSRHPGITVQVQKGLNSTAAGRYQFKASTWASLGLPDFSPASQDEGARILMGRRGMIEPLLAGNFAKAVEKGNREWASLPGSPYGQPTKTLDELKGVYDQSYNTCVSKVFGAR